MKNVTFTESCDVTLSKTRVGRLTGGGVGTALNEFTNRDVVVVVADTVAANVVAGGTAGSSSAAVRAAAAGGDRGGVWSCSPPADGGLVGVTLPSRSTFSSSYNQAINQSINQSINKSKVKNQSTRLSFNHPIQQSIKYTAYLLMKRQLTWDS